MRLRVGPNDEDAYCEIRDELISQFSEWAEDLMLDVDPEGVVSLLDYKWAQGDGELTYWTEPDLEDFLVVWYPRNVATAAEGRPTLIATLRSLLEFLDEHELFDDRSDPTAVLLACLEDVEARAKPIEVERQAREEAARDDDEAFLAGDDDDDDLVAEALELSPDEQRMGVMIDSAMQRWIESLQIGAESGQLADELLGQHTPLTLPIALPPSPLEVDKLAADAPIVRWLDVLARSCENGRQLTTKGTLPAADARKLATFLGPEPEPNGINGHTGPVNGHAGPVNGSATRARSSPGLRRVDQVVRLAQQLGVVAIDGRVLKTEPGWPSPPADPADLVQRAFAVLVEMGPVQAEHVDIEPASVVGRIDAFVDAGLPHIMAILYAAGRPLELARLVEPIAALAWDTFEFPHVEDVDSVQVKVAHALDDLFEVLERVAIVSRGGSTVALTACGHLVAPGLLMAAGYGIKFAGALAEKPALEALAAAAEMDEDDAMAELLVWSERRQPATAAAELTQAALDADDPAVRVLSMAALDFVADDAVDRVRGLLASPLRGYAVVWLTHHGFPAKVDLDPELPETAVDVLGAILEAGGPDALRDTLAELGPADDQRSFIEAIWRTRHPATLPVLEAVSQTHDDDTTAKVARKAAFRHRSWLATVD